MVWLSYYEEYPIYEPAEGGYYYSGLKLIETERLSKRAAKKKFDQLAMELMEETKNDDYPWNMNDIKYGRHIFKGSKYIGDGAYMCIERKKGMHTKGYVPYC